MKSVIAKLSKDEIEERIVDLGLRAKNWRTVFKLVPVAVGAVGFAAFGFSGATFALATWYLSRWAEYRFSSMMFNLFVLGLRGVDGFDEFVASLDTSVEEE